MSFLEYFQDPVTYIIFVIGAVVGRMSAPAIIWASEFVREVEVVATHLEDHHHMEESDAVESEDQKQTAVVKSDSSRNKREGKIIILCSVLMLVSTILVALTYINQSKKQDCFNEYANKAADYSQAVGNASANFQADTAEVFFAIPPLFAEQGSTTALSAVFNKLAMDAGNPEKLAEDFQSIADLLGRSPTGASPATQNFLSKLEEFTISYNTLKQERKDHPVPLPPREVC